MTIYLGGEATFTPLGATLEDNFKRMQASETSIQLNTFFGKKMASSAFKNGTFRLPFEEMILEVLAQSIAKIDARILESEKTLFLISSTKGEIDLSIIRPFESTIRHLVGKYLLKNQPFVISNACISGVAAINLAARYIRGGYYEHVVVVGCDVLSQFVVNGFQSLFATSDTYCRPFDQVRAGVNLGEGSAAVVLSSTKTIFKEEPLELLDGAISNDANHISGPSRTGEGLYQAVIKTMIKHGIQNQEVGFISAHGTATIYNDEMEAIAFGRLGLTEVPINSFKGYIGHTLGAAGVIEVAYTMQSLRKQWLIQSRGYQQCGTSIPLNVITRSQQSHFNLALKTASGFGGCNAALIIKKQ